MQGLFIIIFAALILATRIFIFRGHKASVESKKDSN